MAQDTMKLALSGFCQLVKWWARPSGLECPSLPIRVIWLIKHIMDFHGFSQIFVDFHGFSLIFMDFH